MSPLSRHSPRSKRIGITLITGFLGSGKSTLIHRLLTERHGYRFVVVENEFSSTASVEKAIVTTGLSTSDTTSTKNGESISEAPSALAEFVELPNGCICCAAQDELADALDRLVVRRAADFDHIVVEASGLADPGPVAASLWVDERDADDDSDDDDDYANEKGHNEKDGGNPTENGQKDAKFPDKIPTLHLDAVVTVVDAVHFEPLLERTDFSAEAVIAKKQLALADLVLLNKVDLVGGLGSHEVARITSILRACGCSAPIIPTTRCDVRLSQLLSIKGYDSTSAEASINQIPTELREHSHSAHSTFRRLNINFENCYFDPSYLNRALGELLWREEEEENLEPTEARKASMEIWRMKALVVVKEEKFKWIYQSVHTLFDDSISSLLVDDDSDKSSSFLFIGQHLKDEEIRESISRAILPKELSDTTHPKI